ncbi:hypothetical protein Dimus_028553 [Dionaea muscipula]
MTTAESPWPHLRCPHGGRPILLHEGEGSPETIVFAATYELTAATPSVARHARNDHCSSMAQTTRSGARRRRTGARTGTACSPEEKLARPLLARAEPLLAVMESAGGSLLTIVAHLLAKPAALHAIARRTDARLEEKASC